MRFGTSWRAGNGRREWVSFGPVSLLLFGWLFVLAAILVGAVWLAGELLKAGVNGGIWAHRRWQIRQHQQAVRKVT